ncbi:MAG: hypothetical protein WBF12_15560, partial [Bradyrhizobium sp.]
GQKRSSICFGSHLAKRSLRQLRVRQSGSGGQRWAWKKVASSGNWDIAGAADGTTEKTLRRPMGCAAPRFASLVTCEHCGRRNRANFQTTTGSFATAEIFNSRPTGD